MAKILFVMSAADHWTLNDGTRHPTGFWAKEFAVPYQALVEAGRTVEVVDGTLITGQNPPSSAAIAAELLKVVSA
ncbi:hypothetical protein [Dactylosporangium sp. CA-092794]|uniref:hypothetical protein n=1 Tax=Dactylosporangium sp. CA-092794 TaxID=3239929 RepID=UPI003D92FA67